MQIGDKVRFLNETGGGRITGFQGKDIVLVEDADGFDIPMLRSQVVVIDTNANNFEVKKPKEAPQQRMRYLEDGADDDPSLRPMTYQPKAQERKGGDVLNVCLAFVPEDSRELSSTRFEAYLVNDSNYYISAAFANNEGAAWHLRWQGLLEPNTKQRVDTFERADLNDLERLSVQLIVWKQDKPFMLKPAIDVQMRLDVVKFYKLHVFQTTPFFREPALVYDIVRDDRPVRKVFAGADEMIEALSLPEAPEKPAEAPATEKPAKTAKQQMPEGLERLERLVFAEKRTAATGADAAAGAQNPEPAAEEPMAASPYVPRTREEEREALKAAKRQLKAEQLAIRAKEQAAKESAAKAEQQALKAKELAGMAEQHRRTRQGFGTPKEVLEVDLHINALLDNIEGLSPNVLLNTQMTEFRIMMERNIRRRGRQIVFIYGKDNEVLHESLLKELYRRYRACSYEEAPAQKYGPGALLVTIA